MLTIKQQIDRTLSFMDKPYCVCSFYTWGVTNPLTFFSDVSKLVRHGVYASYFIKFHTFPLCMEILIWFEISIMYGSAPFYILITTP